MVSAAIRLSEKVGELELQSAAAFHRSSDAGGGAVAESCLQQTNLDSVVVDIAVVVVAVAQSIRDVFMLNIIGFQSGDSVALAPLYAKSS